MSWVLSVGRIRMCSVGFHDPPPPAAPTPHPVNPYTTGGALRRPAREERDERRIMSEPGTTDSSGGPAKSSRGRALLVVGILLTAIGAIAMFLFGFGTPGKDTTLSNAVWESSLTIGAALLVGVGILLILVALVRRRRRATASPQISRQVESGVDPQDRTVGTPEDTGMRDRPPGDSDSPGRR
jgi:hypothetical protein